MAWGMNPWEYLQVDVLLGGGTKMRDLAIKELKTVRFSPALYQIIYFDVFKYPFMWDVHSCISSL